ncbi:hypothetical protein [Pedobacter sandarakinus]|uniref:hypothetical protein n=1 Tax=Pedobacter sandarakinus TaxID=353156 RepID=UPI00224820AF|nr:hypothetical protein [Pedobacter sandarakinus]MCX2575281.1 hypothetical protein [Pedobacter sandarakinus]
MPKLEVLQVLVGTWIVSGLAAEKYITLGKITYRWMEGRFFMLREVDLSLENQQHSSLSIIHYDDLEDVFRMQTFDNNGVISISDMNVEGDAIYIHGDENRFSGKVSEEVMVLQWEKRQSYKWHNWMELKLTKTV